MREINPLSCRDFEINRKRNFEIISILTLVGFSSKPGQHARLKIDIMAALL